MTASHWQHYVIFSQETAGKICHGVHSTKFPNLGLRKWALLSVEKFIRPVQICPGQVRLRPSPTESQLKKVQILIVVYYCTIAPKEHAKRITCNALGWEGRLGLSSSCNARLSTSVQSSKYPPSWAKRAPLRRRLTSTTSPNP